MTLADRILRRDFVSHSTELGPGNNVDAVLGSMGEAHVFKIDNVARYIFCGTDQEKFTRADFPELRPPFDASFFEFSVPRESLSNGTKIQQTAGRIGDLLFVQGQTLNVMRFAELGGVVHQCPVVFSLRLDRDTDGRAFHSAGVSRDVAQHWANGVGFGPMSMTFFAISLLSCRNVTTTEHIPSEKLSKKHEKRGRPPLVRWHTLEIGPVTADLDRVRAISEGGLKHALHVCRGHFKTFDRRPLFGRVTGRFWWTPHARGSATEGIVLKDYEISPPEQP